MRILSRATERQIARRCFPLPEGGEHRRAAYPLRPHTAPAGVGASGGFTLLEICTVIVIIGILAVMLFPAIEGTRARLEKTRCTGNLRSLHVAVNSYMQQNENRWPQINPRLIQSDPPAYATAWVRTLESFGVAHETWICPTAQRKGGGVDYKDPKTARIDYLAMPFSSRARSALRWSSQPWFIERGDMHGNGNLVIFPDGRVTELKNIKPSNTAPE